MLYGGRDNGVTEREGEDRDIQDKVMGGGRHTG